MTPPSSCCRAIPPGAAATGELNADEGALPNMASGSNAPGMVISLKGTSRLLVAPLLMYSSKLDVVP